MLRGSSSRTQSRRLAFVLLLVFATAVIIIGILVLGLGLAITHNDAFYETLGLKEQVESRVDYVQYWIGLPYLVTGVSIVGSAVNLRRISLTVCTILLSLICVVLSLGGLVVEGPDFVWWKDIKALEKFWEGQDGFACTSPGDACNCTNGAMTVPILQYADCETVMKISSVYGVLIGCFIVGLIILLASVFMIVYIVSSNREKARRESQVYYTKTRVLKAENPESVFENAVEEVPKPMTQQHINQGYEYPIGSPQTISPPPKPMSYREYKNKTPDSVSQQNADASSVADHDGVVMMDPGRFRLGDDDIY